MFVQSSVCCFLRVRVDLCDSQPVEGVSDHHHLSRLTGVQRLRDLLVHDVSAAQEVQQAVIEVVVRCVIERESFTPNCRRAAVVDVGFTLGVVTDLCDGAGVRLQLFAEADGVVGVVEGVRCVGSHDPARGGFGERVQMRVGLSRCQIQTVRLVLKLRAGDVLKEGRRQM